MKVSALLPVLMLLPGAALADLAGDMAACRALDSDLQRLVCYDAVALEGAAPAAAPAAAPSEAAPAGQWVTDVKVNAMDDTKTVVALLQSSEGAGPFGRKPGLILRCQSRQFEAYISWNDYLGSDGGHNSGTKEVTARFDAATPVSAMWFTSTDSTSTFAPAPQTLFKQIRAAGRLVAQVTPYNSGPVTAVFDLAGVEAATEVLRAECGIAD